MFQLKKSLKIVLKSCKESNAIKPYGKNAKSLKIILKSFKESNAIKPYGKNAYVVFFQNFD
jgi:hypothetical protein